MFYVMLISVLALAFIRYYPEWIHRKHLSSWFNLEFEENTIVVGGQTTIKIDGYECQDQFDSAASCRRSSGEGGGEALQRIPHD